MTPPIPRPADVAPPPDLAIRRAQPHDLPDLLALIDKLCAHHGDTSRMTLARAHTELFRMGGLVAFVARSADRTLGYAVVEAHWRPMHDGPAFDIAHLYVEADCRGRGIGRALIRAARTYAQRQQAARLTIGTHPENAGAAAAYRAMGLAEMPPVTAPRFQVEIDG